MAERRHSAGGSRWFIRKSVASGKAGVWKTHLDSGLRRNDDIEVSNDESRVEDGTAGLRMAAAGVSNGTAGLGMTTAGLGITKK